MGGKYLEQGYTYRKGYEAIHNYPGSSQWYNQLIAAGVSSAAQSFYQDRTAQILDVSDAYTASVTKTQTTQKRGSDPTTVSAMEYQRVRRRRGRKMKRSLRNLYRLTAGSRNSVVLRWQNINQFCTNAVGANKIFNYRHTGNNTYHLPIHVYDLSETVMTSSARGSPLGTGGGVVYLNSNNDIRFDTTTNVGMKLKNTLANGSESTGKTWEIEYDNSAGGYVSGNSDILEWVEISMLCHGRGTKPTRYRIDLCYIPDEEYNPNYIQLNSTTDKSSTAGYEAAMAPFSINPIMKYDPVNNSKRVFKTIMSEDFILSSDVSTYGSTNTPMMRQVRMFWRANRKQRYDFDQEDYVPQAEYAAAGQDYISQTNNPEVGPMWKARPYLVIRAMSTFAEGTEANLYNNFDKNEQPSYDIIIRKKHIGFAN